MNEMRLFSLVPPDAADWIITFETELKSKMGGFLRCVVLLHVLSGIVVLAAVGYVFLVPRMIDPDLTAHTSLGGVSHSSMNIAVHLTPALRREDCTGLEGWDKCAGVWAFVNYRPVNSSDEELAAMKAASSYDESYFDTGLMQTKKEQDFNLVFPLVGLQPDTEYEFGVFMSFPHVRMQLYKSQFRTLPAPRAPKDAFSFVFGSCLMTRSWPLETTDLIANNGPVMSREPTPLFAMLLGDSVYLDAPWKLTPRQAYQRLLSDRGYRKLAWHFPTFYQMDDHEVRNDADDINSTEFKSAAEAFDNYLGMQNKASTRTRFHSFWSGRAAFFLLDTRTQRSPKHLADETKKSLLGHQQLQALLEWEEETKDAGIRFISSPSAWSSSVSRGDGWRHYLAERNQILDVLSARRGTKTILLSGDIHFAMICKLREGIYEISASPISSLPMTARYSIEEASGEEMIFSSQLRQHVARVDVINGTDALISIYSEIPGFGAKLAFEYKI